MLENKVNVGLIGHGNIGSEVARQIDKGSYSEFILTKIVEKKEIKDENIKNKYKISSDPYDIINDPSIDIVVELIGKCEPARTLILDSIKNKKHVVTANKAVISEYAHEIFKEAKKNNVNVGFEASVGGGMKIIKNIKDSLETDNINEIIGILNGTTNYILTRMMVFGLDYETALKEAQEKGFAETVPEFDVSGEDARQKLSILSSTAFNRYIKPNDIHCEGITGIKPIDIISAKDLGYVIKLLAIAKKRDDKFELRVHPTLISKENNLAGILYEMNCVYVIGEHFGPQGYSGKGAGQEPTATAVVYDIKKIANKIKNKAVENIDYFNNPIEEKDIIKIDNIKTKGFISLMSENVPKVWEKIAKIIGDYGINMKNLTQREKFEEIIDNRNYTPDIITIDPIEDLKVKNALEEIKKLDCIKGEPLYLRIED